MFRFTFLTLFFAATAASAYRNTELRLATSSIQRQLQSDNFDIDAFQFNFAGIAINAEIAQQKCPNEWTGMVSCVIQECPNFMDVCPEITIPPEFQGTTAPSATDGDSDMDEEIMTGNTTIGEETLTEETDGNITADASVEVPECGELDEAFCDTFGADLADCCLTDCTEPIQALVVCIIRETTGEDRSDCEIPVCPTSAPGATPDEPKPEVSGAVSVVSQVAALVASLVAFVML